MMDTSNAIAYLLGLILFNSIHADACSFYDKNGNEMEPDDTQFIRIREDMRIGDEVLNVRAYPRQRVTIKGTENAADRRYFRLHEANNTNVQVLLDKSIDDLVDRDVPQNVLKFKIECVSKAAGSRLDELAQLTVNVYIEDINDHQPKFANLPYTVYVDESTPIGTTIFQQISAFDRDKPNTPNSDVQYAMQSLDYDPGGMHFALESPHRPHVILRRQLDFDEGKRMFEIPIVASDRGDTAKSSSAMLTVLVRDSDDLPPKFTESIYRTKINEFSPITGRPVKMPLTFSPPIMAYDQDSLNTTLVYDIISGNDRKLFWINSNTGIVYLMSEIDLEEENLPGNSFVLQVEARQKDSPLKRAVARIEIEITDLNDNRPEFEVELYNISIVENLPSGFSVLQVNAIDRDQGENADFLYMISDEDPDGAFSIDPRTGWLTVRDQELLDREARSRVTMNIQAIEKKEPHGNRNQEPSGVQVEVTLLDANDNTPAFDMGNLYEFKINQNVPIGHIIGYITAKDPDQGRNGMILYELQHPRGSGMVPFRLDSKTGALIVSAALKRGRIAVFVEASDQPANPSERRFSLAVVTVEVGAKVTDGSLDFVGAPYEFWVGADVPIGTSVGQIKTNLDWDVQGEVMYDLLHSYESGVPFAVEERSGIVTVIRELDDFERSIYEFEAVAAHFAPEKGSSKQLLKRTSKSARQIARNGDVYEVEEGTVSQTQNILVTNVTIHVVNPDEEKGILMRGTSSDPIEFRVRENIADALIGQLIYKNVTREEYRSVGNKPLPSPTRSSVTSSRTGKSQTLPTRGSDNRQERFLNSRFNKNYTKLASKPTKSWKRRNRGLDDQFYVPVTPAVFYDDLVAFESRIVDKAYTPIRRKLPPTKATNITTTTARSNRSAEVKPNDLLPEAGAMPKEVIVTPRPFRMNTVHPMLKNGTRLEKQMKQSPMTNDEASRGLRFLIANQHDVTDMITITNDGTLMTLKPLDREERDVYRLTIIAEYFQGYVTGAGIYQVIIHVEDVNDNPPVFNLHTYSGSIAENITPDKNAEVQLDQQMLVHDADLGENAEFTLSLLGEGSQFFTVEKRNSTKRTFEQLLTMHTIGNQRFARALSKMNGNRKSPNASSHFIDNNFLDVPHYVLKFIGPNVLDRENQNFYEFTVVAKDRGGLSSEVKLTLYVTDVNDCAPIFDRIAVFKDAGVEIIEHTNDLEIYFMDKMEPDTLTYPIRHHMPGDADRDTIAASASNVNYEIMQLAESGHIGTPRFIDMSGATNKTRRPPSRARSRRRNNEKPYPVFSIVESIDVGSTVLKLTATDDDYEENAQVFYKIVSETHMAPRNAPKRMLASKFFGIDMATGELRVHRPLPAQAEILLNISAFDAGGLSDHTAIKFKVMDINDHSPVFERSWYTFDISEGEYKHMVLGKVVATDEDFGDNANITYTLQASEMHPFYVTPLSGILKVNGELDRELKSMYELKIIAMDNSLTEKRLTSTAEIEININDINDNAPTFIGYDEMLTLNAGRKLNDDADDIIDSINDSEMPYNLPVYKAYLSRSTEPGTFVKQIAAVDKDFNGNGNGLVMYALRHSSLPYFFEIDSRDGVIMTIAKFSRYHGYEHINLTIIASDLGTPSKSSVALLIVNLQGDDVYDSEDAESADTNSLFQHKYYEIEVPENNVVPTMLLQINATNNGNKDRAFKWSIITEMGNAREFRIDPNNGTLWLVRSLDREVKDLYNIKIRADPVYREGRHMASIMYPIADERISGLQENEVRIVLRVADENDNPPKFIGNGKPIVAVIPNTANFGYPVTTVQATDDDIGINADIRYMLLNEPSKLFEIDEISGSIRVLGPMSAADQRVYGFDVKATDRRGAEDGKSTITNVFVYVLDDKRQVRLVLSGTPVDVEKEVKSLTDSLSEATGLDVRIRMLEPHNSENDFEPATNVYVYAVDPRTNSIVDMDVLQSTMTGLSMHNLTTSAHILGLAELGEYHTLNTKIPHTTYNGAIRTSELATIILAFVVFAGGLATAFCVVCVRYKRRRRRQNRVTNAALAYAITGASSSPTRPLDELSTESNLQMLPQSTLATATAVSQKTNDRLSGRRREYIDVPLPQSVLNSNFNLMEHENRCVRYNPLQHQNQNLNNLDTSVPSLHSSGCDSGVGLTREMNDKHVIRVVRESQRRASRAAAGDAAVSGKRTKRCMCGFAATGVHVCSGGEESSDSYEDSLKNVPCIRVSRRTSFPKAQAFRRSLRINHHPTARGRHSFSGFK